MAGGNGDAGGVSAYEAKRLQRMQQNQQMMQSLGIQLQPKARKPRVLARDLDASEPREVRRSSRLIGRAIKNPVTAAGDPMPTPLDVLLMGKRSRLPIGLTRKDVVKRQRVQNDRVTRALGNVPTVQEPPSRRKPSVNCGSLDMDVASFHDRWLGKQIWPVGKRTVMESMVTTLHTPTFAIVSSLQRFRNGVALFINAGGASGYPNTFSEMTAPGQAEPTAVHVQWFAPARLKIHSRGIAMLMETQRGDVSLWLGGAAPPSEEPSTDGPADPVMLFVRHINGPYIYCGRLGYLGHYETAPLEFRFQLLDLDKLEWSKVKKLLDAADEFANEDAVLEDRQ